MQDWSHKYGCYSFLFACTENDLSSSLFKFHITFQFISLTLPRCGFRLHQERHSDALFWVLWALCKDSARQQRCCDTGHPLQGRPRDEEGSGKTGPPATDSLWENYLWSVWLPSFSLCMADICELEPSSFISSCYFCQFSFLNVVVRVGGLCGCMASRGRSGIQLI